MASIAGIRERLYGIRSAAAQRWAQRSAARSESTRALDAAGPGGADSRVRNQEYVWRQEQLRRAPLLRARGALPLALERKIGPTLDFMAAAPDEAAARAGQPVARIVDSIDPKVEPKGFATGFLVSPRLLLTNQHVFPSAGDARHVGANFLFQQTSGGISRGVVFELDPDTFFLNDEGLDYALVAIKPQSVEGSTLSDLGVITLIEATPKIMIGDPVNIIQYPEGGMKQWATTNNRLVDLLDAGFLHYTTDTLEGSSGSPAFSQAWELVALHHCGVPRVDEKGRMLTTDGQVATPDTPDEEIDWVANEGARVSALVKSLSAARLTVPSQARLLGDLIAGTSDPAEEIARIAGADGPPVVNAGPNTVSLERSPMPGMQVTFTGPVTINLTPAGAPPALQPALPSNTPPTAPEKTLRFDPKYDDREGYREDFLGGNTLRVPLPTVVDARRQEILPVDGGEQLKYHHFTLVMNKPRRLQFWSAVNVNYAPGKRTASGRKSFGTDRWIPDPRIPARAQIFDAEIYAPAGQVDRGHIVRREDNAWGNDELEMEFSNSDTFHWTNCTPQHQAFNRESPGKDYGGIRGLWGDFEGYIQKELLRGKDTQACILAGPVLDTQDPTVDLGAGVVQYPTRFWKVVVVRASDGAAPGLAAYGFMLSQADVVGRFGIEIFEVGRFAKFQVPLEKITEASGVEFDARLIAVDQMGKAEGRIEAKPRTAARVKRPRRRPGK